MEPRRQHQQGSLAPVVPAHWLIRGENQPVAEERSPNDHHLAFDLILRHPRFDDYQRARGHLPSLARCASCRFARQLLAPVAPNALMERYRPSSPRSSKWRSNGGTSKDQSRAAPSSTPSASALPRGSTWAVPEQPAHSRGRNYGRAISRAREPCEDTYGGPSRVHDGLIRMPRGCSCARPCGTSMMPREVASRVFEDARYRMRRLNECSIVERIGPAWPTPGSTETMRYWRNQRRRRSVQLAWGGLLS
jgi:hypothetical protein